MSTRIDSPIAPNFSRRLSKKTVNIINEFPSPPSPTEPQTFLYSPSEPSFRMDSPVLPSIERQPSETTLCNSIVEGAYPSPLHQRTFLHSSSEASFDSSFSGWRSDSTAVDSPTPPLTSHRISDWLPEETDFYTEDEDYIAEWNVSPPNEQVETETDPLVIKTEFDLPIIRERDFPYYPTPADIPSTDGEPKMRRRRLEKRRESRVFSFRTFVRKVLLKAKVRRYT